MRPTFDAGPAEARIDALLARDLGRFRSRPDAARRARVLARIGRAAVRPADAAGLRWAAGLAAAGLLLALGFLAGPRSPAAGDEPVALQPTKAELALAEPRRSEFANAWLGRVRGHGAGFGVSLDEPLLDEARRLADDGARVAVAVLHRLPGPLRQAISGSARR